MPVRATKDVWQVETDSIEPAPFRAPGDSSDCYPYPFLQKAQKSSSASLATVVLENDWLSATLCPDLGGRIVGLVDKRTGFEVLRPPDRLEAVEGGFRGIRIGHGIQIGVDGAIRENGLGKVDCLVREDLGAIFLAGLTLGTPFDWHTCLSLGESSANLDVELRVHNRSLYPAPLAAFVLVGEAAGLGKPENLVLESGLAVFDRSSDSGVVVSGRSAFVAADTLANGDMRLSFVPPGHVVGPREVLQFRFSIGLVSSLQGLSAASLDAVATVHDSGVRIRSQRDMPGHKLFVLDPEGKTLEATVDLRVNETFEADLGFKPSALKLVGPDRTDVLELEASGPSRLAGHHAFLGSAPSATMAALALAAGPGAPPSAESEFFRALRSGEAVARPPTMLKSAACTWNAMIALRTGDPHRASDLVDEALLTNSEDQLLWWLKAVCERHKGTREGEGPEILNAHFLAPLEPALRVEAFLASPHDPEADPSAILKPLVDDLDGLLDVLGLLLDCGLYEDAARVLTAVLDMRDVPLLRYLFAWCLLTTTSMAAEVGLQVEKGSKLALVPPFPWRRFEVEAVNVLSERFPNDTKLGLYRGLAKRNPA